MQTVPTNSFSSGTMHKKDFEIDGRKKGPWTGGEIGNQPSGEKILTHQKRRGKGAARSLVLPLQCCRVAFSFFLSVVRRRRVGPNHNLALKGAARANHHIVSTHTFSHFSFPDFSSHPWTPNFHRNAALVGQTQKKVVQKTVALLPHLLTWVQMIVSLGLEE